MTKNPFTPGLTIEPKRFVGRKEEIKLFEESLKQACLGNPTNIAILGDRGIGKSSLLRKFEDIVKNKECLVVRRDVDSSVDSLQMLAYFILKTLKEEGKVFFTKYKKAKNIAGNFLEKYKVSASISAVGGSVEKRPKVVIQEELFKELADIAKNIQSEVPVSVIMLDEAEHIQSIKGAWGFIRSVFTRLSENDHHFLVVVSGKLSLFKEIKEIFSPMERFFYPRELGLLSAEETIEAIEKPLAGMGIKITKEVKNHVVDYTDGHPFIIQVFGNYLAQIGQKTIDLELFKAELPKILERLKIQVFRDRYNSASDKEKKIPNFMASSQKDMFQPIEIINGLKMKKVYEELRRLLQKDCLKKVERSKYTFFHKLFKTYLQNEIVSK